MTDIVEEAVRWASHNFKVFPARVTPVTIKGQREYRKVPMTLNGQKQASNDPDEVRALFTLDHEAIKPKAREYNWKPDILALVHERKVLIVDVDVKHGKPGLANFEKLRPIMPKPLATVVTASGGFHWYYPPAPVEVLPKRKTDYLPGVDMLIGKGWVAVPPSSGYRFVDGSMETISDALA